MTSAIMTLKNMWNMVRFMDGGKIKGASGGVNQSGVRNYNERLLLSMLARSQKTPSSALDIAGRESAETTQPECDVDECA